MFVREMLLPGAAPMIFTGLRLSLQACWTTLVAGELIGAIAGLGHVLYQSWLDIFPAMILVGMVAVAVTGGVMTKMLEWVELRAMPWRRAVTPADERRAFPSRILSPCRSAGCARLFRAVDADRASAGSCQRNSCRPRSRWPEKFVDLTRNPSSATRCSSISLSSFGRFARGSCSRRASACRSA